MPESRSPLFPDYPHFLHGGDYNPDQWSPEVWDEDVELMEKAHCNAMSVGIFSWSNLEPEEGRYEFGWLDTIMDKLDANDVKVVLATPTAAQPAWMSQQYPEVLRTGVDRVRRLHGNRVNYCLTSPVYREKCREITSRLANRYGNHPALLLWHIHNEYGGACYCDQCEEAFRRWLRDKYDSLEELNAAWWTDFWSHTFTNWSQIEAPGGDYGEHSIMGMKLDWKRFVTHQTRSLIRNEAEILRQKTPEIPVTTNFMGTFPGLNYWRLAEELDVISWDAYPRYHDLASDTEEAVSTSFCHDLNRSMKGGQPFMLMETTPSSQNWLPTMKLKRPGVHRLACLQAVAHGSDTVQYFQWRKGRGGSEKFHGAVVDHVGHENTRVFEDVSEVGQILEQLDPVVGTSVDPEIGLIFDWENRWAAEVSVGPRKDIQYEKICKSHYRPFWENGIPVDITEMDCDFDRYRLLIAPMLYMIKPGVAERMESFVENGGTLVMTYWSGIADENDLCFTSGWPGPLRDLAGVWAEEMDVLYEDETCEVAMSDDNQLGLDETYDARIFCDLIHAEDAKVLGTYNEEFYAGRPALTVNEVGDGQVYYMAFRNDGPFLRDFYTALSCQQDIQPEFDADLPEGVTAQLRTDGKRDFIFLLNFNDECVTVKLGQERCTNYLTGESADDEINMGPYGSQILER